MLLRQTRRFAERRRDSPRARRSRLDMPRAGCALGTHRPAVGEPPALAQTKKADRTARNISSNEPEGFRQTALQSAEKAEPKVASEKRARRNWPCIIQPTHAP